MKASQMKSALNAELSAAGFKTQISKITETGVNTTIIFNSYVFHNHELMDWLNKRFIHGFSIDNTDYQNVFINTPKQAVDKKLQSIVHQLEIALRGRMEIISLAIYYAIIDQRPAAGIIKTVHDNIIDNERVMVAIIGSELVHQIKTIS